MGRERGGGKNSGGNDLHKTRPSEKTLQLPIFIQTNAHDNFNAMDKLLPVPESLILNPQHLWNDEVQPVGCAESPKRAREGGSTSLPFAENLKIRKASYTLRLISSLCIKTV